VVKADIRSPFAGFNRIRFQGSALNPGEPGYPWRVKYNGDCCDYITVIRRFPFAAAAAGYSALTIVMTWPLVLHLSSTVPHDLGDPLLSTSLLWWNAHVVPLTTRWWNGFAFFPAHGLVTFSDHRLGESLIASPLQWLGCSPVAAYNITFLATFPLCALAAHGLAFTLTDRHDAATLAGLAYGFNPYRAAHLEHLELLAAFGMAAALAALHQYRGSGRVRWLVAFTIALIVQGLCTSYYLLFFSVLLLLWIVWFGRWRDWRFMSAIAVGCAATIAALAPIGLGYLRMHHAYGLARNYGESLTFSADVTSIFTASDMSAVWRWTSALNGAERQVFPGLTITALALIGALAAARNKSISRDRGDILAILCWWVSALFAAIAIVSLAFGPWRLVVGPLKLSGDVFYKPMSVSMLALFAGLALSSPIRSAWTRRSPLTFYLLATLFLFLCALGPKPAFAGFQVLYEPPYAWLMRLPVFGSGVRVPARFAMLAVLTLAVAGALAFNRLALRPSSRRVAAIVLAAGIVADGWLGHLPLPSVPDAWPEPRASAFDAVMELPLGNIIGDASAMYRATRHRRPVVNGISGFSPAHYRALQMAVEEQDDAALDAVADTGRLLFAVDNSADADAHWRRFLESAPRATYLGEDGVWSFFTLTAEHPAPACTADALTIRSAFDSVGPIDVGPIVDANPATIRASPHPQRAGDVLVLDMGRTVRPCALLMSLGQAVYLFPRKLSVATSLDGSTWQPVFDGSTSTIAIRAAIARPNDPWLQFPMAGAAARFIRLRLERSHPKYLWVIADLVVRGGL
jgi:hypothetical protein